MRIKSATLRDVFPLEIRSASGIEIVGPHAFVVCSSSAMLYVLDTASLKVIKKVPLFDTDASDGVDIENLPAGERPDFEMTCVLPPTGRDPLALFIAGSGSASPHRDFCAIVPLLASGEFVAETYFLGAIYDALRSRSDVVGSNGGGLSLEGCTVCGAEIVFFQRGNGIGQPDIQISFPLPHFLAALKDDDAPLPQFTVKSYHLPDNDGKHAVFSGAATLFGTRPPHVLFSAVSGTPGTGEAASYIGHIQSALDPSSRDSSSTLVRQAPFMGRRGDAYPGSIEGLSVIEEKTVGEERQVKIAAVSVLEGGSCEYLTIDVVLGP